MEPPPVSTIDRESGGRKLTGHDRAAPLRFLDRSLRARGIRSWKKTISTAASCSSGCQAAARGRRGPCSASFPPWCTSRWVISSARYRGPGKFGREIEKYTSQGLMVPDDLTVRIFERHLMILEMQELRVARATYPDPRRTAPQLCPGGAARLDSRRASRSSI